MKHLLFILTFAIMLTYACGGNGNANSATNDSLPKKDSVEKDIPVESSILILNSIANKLLDTTAKVEELAKGFGWAEGPVWVDTLQAILFSDVRNNKIYKWTEMDGLSLYLDPSGSTNQNVAERGEGSNGLTLDAEGDLILCQHGDRRIASLLPGVLNPKSEYITMADNYKGKKFNSPNDLAIKSNGAIYFTDPTYGLLDKSKQEINFNGVYRLGPNGNIDLLVDSLSWPNGIAFSPDEKTIYVANSDKDKAVWYIYKVDEKGFLKQGRIFFDAMDEVKKGEVGLPDGLKVHKSGTLFATGPGGVYLFTPQGEKIGMIKTSKATANCAFDKLQKYLYLTTTDRLLRLKLK